MLYTELTEGLYIIPFKFKKKQALNCYLTHPIASFPIPSITPITSSQLDVIDHSHLYSKLQASVAYKKSYLKKNNNNKKV